MFCNSSTNKLNNKKSVGHGQTHEKVKTQTIELKFFFSEIFFDRKWKTINCFYISTLTYPENLYRTMHFLKSTLLIFQIYQLVPHCFLDFFACPPRFLLVHPEGWVHPWFFCSSTQICFNFDSFRHDTFQKKFFPFQILNQNALSYAVFHRLFHSSDMNHVGRIKSQRNRKTIFFSKKIWEGFFVEILQKKVAEIIKCQPTEVKGQFFCSC